MILCFIGCSDTASEEPPIVVMPDKETAQTLNGYKTEPQSSDLPSSEEQTSVSSESSSQITTVSSVYYGNKNSKKYHKADCRYAISMKESNRVTFNSLNDAINSGYTPCSVCHK